jgi:hypothetical protein
MLCRRRTLLLCAGFCQCNPQKLQRAARSIDPSHYLVYALLRDIVGTRQEFRRRSAGLERATLTNRPLKTVARPRGNIPLVTNSLLWGAIPTESSEQEHFIGLVGYIAIGCNGVKRGTLHLHKVTDLEYVWKHIKMSV